jgi:ATP-binding cassette subfamily B protein
MIFILLPRASVSFKRIGEVLSSKPRIKDPIKYQEFPTGISGEIEFKNVSFSYPNSEEAVLKDISFKIDQGESIAIIGGTGSGKSTLINLIPRFYDVTSGEILVDGVDIREVRLKDLHNKLGYVPQRGILFSGSIKENIAYPMEGADLDLIRNSANIAQASQFIEKLNDKYNSHVAQSGSNFSGGQKQRLSIARAIAKRAEILIFDDSFSALDFKTDQALRSALNKYIDKTTLITVTQRIGTAMHADRVIVLDQGMIVGIGSHKKLLKECKIYRQIAKSQLSQEEIDKGGDNE